MNPFSSKALLVIFGVGLLTFGLGLLLAAFSADVFDQSSPGNDTYSRSLVGHRALAEFLRRSGLIVVISRSSGLRHTNRSFPLLLFEPEPAVEHGLFYRAEEGGSSGLRYATRATRIQKLIRDALEADAPVVLTLPKWKVRPSMHNPGWIGKQRLLSIRSVEELLQEAAGGAVPADEEVEYQGSGDPQPAFRVHRAPTATDPRADALGLAAARLELGDAVQLLSGDSRIEPLVHCEEGVLFGRLEQGIYVISDPDLLNNRGLAKGDHAALVLALLAQHLGAEGVVVDETMHGFTSGESLLGRALRFPLGLISIHALAAMVLAAWSLAGRFGKPRDPPPELPPGKQLLMDNTSRLLLAGGDHADALRRYLRVTLTRLARRFSLAGAGSEAPDGRGSFEVERDLYGRLQSLSDARGLALDLEGLVRASRETHLRPAEALRLARRIHAWRRALLGAERTHAARR